MDGQLHAFGLVFGQVNWQGGCYWMVDGAPLLGCVLALWDGVVHGLAMMDAILQRRTEDGDDDEMSSSVLDT